MAKNTRVWLDTTTLANMRYARSVMDEVIASGNTLVIANTMLDVEAFQTGIEWLKGHLKAGRIRVEMWLTGEQMVAKDFYWSSCQMKTTASDSFEQAIANLPNRENILKLKALMDTYGLPRGSWEQGPWAPPAPITPELQAKLGVTADATRTEILAACLEKDCMHDYDEYNASYNKGLATQHTCAGMLNSDGTITMF